MSGILPLIAFVGLLVGLAVTFLLLRDRVTRPGVVRGAFPGSAAVPGRCMK